MYATFVCSFSNKLTPRLKMNHRIYSQCIMSLSHSTVRKHIHIPFFLCGLHNVVMNHINEMNVKSY